MAKPHNSNEGSQNKDRIVQLNQELSDAKQELAIIKEKCARYNHLFSEMSHELRTPMSVVLMYAKLLSDKVKPEDPEFQNKALHAINQNIKKVYGMFGLYMHSWHILSFLNKKPSLERTNIAEVFQRFNFYNSVRLDPQLQANIDRYMIESAIRQFSEILNDYASNDVSLSISLETDWIIINLNNRQQFLPDYFYPTDPDTGKLDCTNHSPPNLLCEGAELINKHGGIVSLDVSEDTGTTISFTLPIYKEKTLPST